MNSVEDNPMTEHVHKVAEHLLELDQGADYEFTLRLSDPETKEPTAIVYSDGFAHHIWSPAGS